MASFANLQLLLGEGTDAARERILYVITAYMDAQGMMPCGRDRAERTVCFAGGENGVWAVFDDCADRLDVRALDGLGRSLTGKLKARAVGSMGSDQGGMLRLYVDGRLRDTYLSSTGAPFRGAGAGLPGGLGRLCCRGRAIRWRPVLRPDHTVRELSDAFLRCQGPDGDIAGVRSLLAVGPSAEYGFASLGEKEGDGGVRLPGMVTLYFCAANHVRQRLVDRLLRPARASIALGALIHPSRRRLWQA